MENPCQAEVDRHFRRVQLYAYMLWERAGRPEGRDVEFWLKSESAMGKLGRMRWVVYSSGNHCLSNIYREGDAPVAQLVDAADF